MGVKVVPKSVLIHQNCKLIWNKPILVAIHKLIVASNNNNKTSKTKQLIHSMTFWHLKWKETQLLVKFIFSEKATKFCEISALGQIYGRDFAKILWPSQNTYMNFSSPFTFLYVFVQVYVPVLIFAIHCYKLKIKQKHKLVFQGEF